jgi:hypothetical protein
MFHDLEAKDRNWHK